MRIWGTGVVKRWHTEPIDAQSIAEHSWGVAVILMELAPPEIVTLKLVKAALHHDCAERYTGDLPATVKWAEPRLKREMDRLESKWETELGISVSLSGVERRWLKAADWLELVLYCDLQVKKGNTFAAGPRDRVIDRLMDSPETPTLVKHYVMDNFETDPGRKSYELPR